MSLNESKYAKHPSCEGWKPAQTPEALIYIKREHHSHTLGYAYSEWWLNLIGLFNSKERTQMSSNESK